MPSTRITARQFYYDVLAPEERGLSYAQVHHKWLYENPGLIEKYRQVTTLGQIPPTDLQKLIEVARSFKPALSNDPLLNKIVDELIVNTSGPVQAYLKNIFVAKRNDPLENAEALVSFDSYEGDLIIFYVGLSLACHEYANLFARFIHHKLADESDSRKEEARLASELIQEGKKLFAAQTKWKAEGDCVRLDLATILEDDPIGITIAAMTDRFILCHEIAHHLLGHTGKDDLGSSYLDDLPASAKKWVGRSKQHREELQADALAIVLATGYLKPRSALHRGDRIADVALGSLLTLTVLGQAAGVNSASITHPSVKDRLSQCALIIESLENNSTALKAAFDVCEFHNVLEYVQECPDSAKTQRQSLRSSILKTILHIFSRAKE